MIRSIMREEGMKEAHHAGNRSDRNDRNIFYYIFYIYRSMETKLSCLTIYAGFTTTRRPTTPPAGGRWSGFMFLVERVSIGTDSSKRPATMPSHMPPTNASCRGGELRVYGYMCKERLVLRSKNPGSATGFVVRRHERQP